jgi:cyclophilin family peptidyl-prolyl cis-trans isomerase
MLKNVIAFFVCICLFQLHSSAQVKKKPVVAKKGSSIVKKPVAKSKPIGIAKVIDTSIRVKLTTEFGIMIIKLSDRTPKHRDNFVKLVKEHFYDSLLFHRVISQFMIQGGDPSSKYAQPGQMLGMGDVGYTVPAEFDSTLYHKKGALCAARTENPEKASSGCQFYIVQGRPSSDMELDQIARGGGYYYSSKKRMTYKVKGGTPFLDNNYTVFGEVESGLEVIDKIAAVEKQPGDRPTKDVRMFMELVEPVKENKIK